MRMRGIREDVDRGALWVDTVRKEGRKTEPGIKNFLVEMDRDKCWEQYLGRRKSSSMPGKTTREGDSGGGGRCPLTRGRGRGRSRTRPVAGAKGKKDEGQEGVRVGGEVERLERLCEKGGGRPSNIPR